MASTFKWTATSTVDVIFSLTSAIATSSYAGVSSAIANGTSGLYPYAALELVSTALSPTAGGYIDIWLYPTIDGTNYADADKFLQTASLLCTFQVDTAAATAQRITKWNIGLPPLDFKMEMRNETGGNLSSGTKLNLVRYYDQVV